MKTPLAALAGLASLTVAVPAWSQHAGHEGHETPAPAPPEADPHAGHANPDTPEASEPSGVADAHSGHAMPQSGTERSATMDHGAMGHAAMDHGSMDHGSMDHGAMDHGAMDHGAMDHGAMDHGAMDHGAMDHGAMDHAGMSHRAPEDNPGTSASPGPTMETPPPPEAGSGPPRAADLIWGAEAMQASRQELLSHGAFPLFWFQADRAELQVRDGADGFLWDAQGYYGTPTRRFWFKSEGEGTFDEGVEEAELQALYSQAVSPFFDVQAGLRQDVGGPETTHATLGVQGLAPYMFEVDAALFLSHRGDLTARIEAELDQRITQSLILQPRAELTLAAQDVPELGIGAGVEKIELGLRLRYEITREFAPYLGVEQGWRLGETADLARVAGDKPSVTSFVAGVRFWF